MDHAAGVGVGHRLADLLEDPQEAGAGRRRRLARSASSDASVRPLTSFMVKYGRPSAKRAQLVDRDDARVLELAADLRLLDEPPDQLGAVAVLLQQDLDRQVAAQVPIPALEDRPHAAAGDLAEDVVTARFVGGDHVSGSGPTVCSRVGASQADLR